MKRYWLWVWTLGSKIKSGYDFDSEENAKNFFYRHFHDESVEHEIIYEEA